MVQAGRTVSGTLSAALAADESLQISIDGGATWITPTVTGTAWSVTDSSSHTADWTIEAQVLDLAGNLGTLASQAVTFDNTPPAAPSAPDLDPTADSGVSNTDNITNVAMPMFDGIAEAGATIKLFDGATMIGTGVARFDGCLGGHRDQPAG